MKQKNCKEWKSRQFIKLPISCLWISNINVLINCAKVSKLWISSSCALWCSCSWNINWSIDEIIEGIIAGKNCLSPIIGVGKNCHATSNMSHAGIDHCCKMPNCVSIAPGCSLQVVDVTYANPLMLATPWVDRIVNCLSDINCGSGCGKSEHVLTCVWKLIVAATWVVAEDTSSRIQISEMSQLVVPYRSSHASCCW